jgi:polyribonucleotide nucleotidyltransferase
MDATSQTINNDEMQKAYEQLMKRRAYSAEYMRKFREERREEYNAQRRAMYARKKEQGRK